MVKYRIIFEKKVFAYIDVEAEDKTKAEEIAWEEAWEQDSFNYPDSDWQVSKIKEVEE
jgi:hypothetical protein